LGPLNLVKLGHCAKLSSNMSLSVYMLNKQKLYLLKNEFILSEFSRRTYMTIPKQTLNSDHQFRCDIFIAYLLRTSNKCKYETKSPSIILNLNEWIDRKIKQISCKFNEAIVDYKKNWFLRSLEGAVAWFRSHDTTFKNCWCIWPTMKIHADTDSTSSNFSHFFCYTL